MVSVAALPVLDTTPPPAGASRRRGRIRWGRWVLLTLTGIYFLVPLYAAIKFALTKTNGSGFSFGGVTGIFSIGGFGAAAELSARLAAVTLLITLVLMVPTAVFVHLRLPKLRTLFDGITLLPIVIPPVILIVGVLQVAPTSLKATPYLLSLEYAVLAMPFAYRSLDAGLAAIDLKTMVEASRSLGGGWMRTMIHVVVPNLRTAILSATVLTVALVLGEYTMASFDLQTTFSVWIYNTDQGNAHVSTSASLLALIATWVLLVGIVSVGSRKKGTGIRARRRAARADLSPGSSASPGVTSPATGGFFGGPS